MSTESQVSANRRNAAKSTGPKTTVGKAIVAQNALKHGLLARQDVVMGEDPQEFDLHRAQILAELAPVGKMETLFAEQIVSLSWRLRRAGRLQNEVFDALLARDLRDSMLGFLDELTPKDEVRLRSDCKTDPTYAVGRMVTKDYHDARVLDRLQMYEQRIGGSLHRTLADLERFQLKRKLGPGDSRSVSEASGQRFEGHGPSTQETPCGVTTNGTDSAKQSQFVEASSSTPAPGGDPSRGRLGHMGDEPMCETKPMESEASSGVPALQTSNLTLPTCRQTPCGVTTSGSCPMAAENLLCETKPISHPACEADSGTIQAAAGLIPPK